MRRSCLALIAVGLCACGPRELRVTMNPDNNSGQSGFAVIQDFGDEMVITIDTSVPDYVGPMGQLVHVHRGNCGEVGEIMLGLNRLNTLADKPDRWGSTTRKKHSELMFKFEDFKSGDWIINAHDERDKDVYVSCGEIPKP